RHGAKHSSSTYAWEWRAGRAGGTPRGERRHAALQEDNERTSAIATRLKNDQSCDSAKGFEQNLGNLGAERTRAIDAGFMENETYGSKLTNIRLRMSVRQLSVNERAHSHPLIEAPVYNSQQNVALSQCPCARR